MKKEGWAKTLGAGLLAGLVAAFAMTLVMALQRTFLGVPLPAELGGDRFLPTLFNVQEFLDLLGRLGGPIAAKRTALISGYGGQIAAGVGMGLLYGLVVGWERARGAGRAWRFGISRAGVLFAAVAVALTWVGNLAVLWPALDSNYRGLTPGLATAATVLGLLVSYAVAGVALVLAYHFMTSRRQSRQSAPASQPTGQPTDQLLGRGAFLAGGAGLILVLASGLPIRRVYERSVLPYDGLQYLGGDVQPITPNNRFYVVTKNIIDPYVRKAAWRLQVRGLVDNPRTYDFEELAALQSVEQEMTLECISNRVGAGLMSNAVWKGIPLRSLLEDAGPQPEAVEVFFHAADGYTHSASLEKAMEETTLLAYEMNGEPLPDRHGYPARILVPGYFGEGSVKWVTRIELVDHRMEGYYGKQGWEAREVPTESHFDVARFSPQLPATAGQTVALKGIGFAGDRGISKVEVSTDDGQSWQEARITYPGTQLTWVFWSYDWRPQEPGEYKLVVRATDGDGELQTSQGRGVGSGKGTTGYHRVTASVEA